MIFTWVLLVLVVYRLAELIAIDKLTERARCAIGKKADKPYSLTWYIAELINCPYCIGVWIAFVAALFLQPVDVKSFALYWLSIAGGQAFLESIGGRNGTE